VARDFFALKKVKKNLLDKGIARDLRLIKIGLIKVCSKVVKK